MKNSTRLSQAVTNKTFCPAQYPSDTSKPDSPCAGSGIDRQRWRLDRELGKLRKTLKTLDKFEIPPYHDGEFNGVN